MAADLAVPLGFMLSSTFLPKRNLPFSICSPRVNLDAGASRRIAQFAASLHARQGKFLRASFLLFGADVDVEVFRKLVILLTCC